MASAWQPNLVQGLHGSGARDYDWRQWQRVLNAVQSARPGAPLTVEELVTITTVPGRTVRAVLSDADGQAFLLGGTAGYYVCEYSDDADSLSHSLRSQISSMTARLERRERLGLSLPRRQDCLL